MAGELAVVVEQGREPGQLGLQHGVGPVLDGHVVLVYVQVVVVLAQQAVTCVIPGTAKPEHMRDNVRAGLGAYPDPALLKRMASEIAT